MASEEAGTARFEAAVEAPFQVNAVLHALIAGAIKLQRLSTFLRNAQQFEFTLPCGVWRISDGIAPERDVERGRFTAANGNHGDGGMGLPGIEPDHHMAANPVIVRGTASFTPLAGAGIYQRTAPVKGNGALAWRDWKYAEICGTRFNSMAPMTNTSKIRKKRFQLALGTATRFGESLYFAKRCFSFST